jgi:uncharacterized protein (DUF305 family)
MIGNSTPLSRAAVGLLVAAIGASACASATAGTTTTASAPGSLSDTGSVRQPYTAADVRFMSDMIGHHAQAIQISRWVETHGASSQLRILAGRIINAQRDEIALMQQWLRERGQTAPEVSETGMMMGEHAGHAMHMPGMLTADQMAQLDQATGKEFDRLFLTFMIKHHQGAVAMVKELVSSQGAALDDTVFKLASDVSAEQTTEIDRMQQMLADLMFGT